MESDIFIMKKLVAIVLSVAVIFGCVTVGTISGSAKTTKMVIKTTTIDKTLYEGNESHIVVGLKRGDKYFRLDDLKCMQKYITYKSSDKKKVFITTSGKVLCFDSSPNKTIKLTTKVKIPSDYYEYEALLSKFHLENPLRYSVLKGKINRGETVTSRISVKVLPLRMSGILLGFGITKHTKILNLVSSKEVKFNLTSTSDKKAFGLIAINTPYVKTLRWTSSNSKVIKINKPKKAHGYMEFVFKKPNFNGSVKLYLKDNTNHTLRTIKINHKYLV